MKTSPLILLLVCALLANLVGAGCSSTIPALVRDGYHKTSEDSALLRVGRFWIEAGSGKAVTLAGFVTRKSPEGDTRGSRLQVILRDAEGRTLLTETLGFEPQNLPEEWGPHAPAATFRHTFSRFPAGVVAITVRVTE